MDEGRGNKGFDNLIGTHTEALESNSVIIANLLEALNEKARGKKMSIKDTKDIRDIKKTLDIINKEIDKL